MVEDTLGSLVAAVLETAGFAPVSRNPLGRGELAIRFVQVFALKRLDG